jgi:hypothetical protein
MCHLEPAIGETGAHHVGVLGCGDEQPVRLHREHQRLAVRALLLLHHGPESRAEPSAGAIRRPDAVLVQRGHDRSAGREEEG